MSQVDFREGELFYEPPKQYPESEFETDGIKVVFRYLTKNIPRFDFRGDISETGYYCFFPHPEQLDRYGVEGAAREAVKIIRAEFHKEQEKLKRKKKKTV